MANTLSGKITFTNPLHRGTENIYVTVSSRSNFSPVFHLPEVGDEGPHPRITQGRLGSELSPLQVTVGPTKGIALSGAIVC